MKKFLTFRLGLFHFGQVVCGGRREGGREEGIRKDKQEGAE